LTNGLRARGATLPDLFAEVALAVLAQALDPSAVAEREVREVRAHGRTLETLMMNWINECLYVHEVEGFAWRRIDFAVFESAPTDGAEPLRLHAFLHGEEVSPERLTRAGEAELPPGSVEIRAAEDGFEAILGPGSSGR
jgi:SHS2 domain-containing protein